MKKIALFLLMIMVCAVSLTVYANSSPTSDFSTDSTDILISEADSSIPVIKKLLRGDEPKEVLADDSLDGYSTLGVFSVSAVAGYDFSVEEETVIKTAGITSDMKVKVKLLDSSNTWSDVPCSLSTGVVSAKLAKEGQVAVFAQVTVDMSDVKDDATTESQVTTEDKTEDDTEATTEDTNGGGSTGGSPKTGDMATGVAAIALLSLLGIAVGAKKLGEE